jgi:nudix motif 8
VPSTSPPPGAFTDDVLADAQRRLSALARRRIDDDLPRAAVLVPLCHADGRAGVLFTKRSERVGTHKGQVSFPGGRMDPDDADEVACALRELAEEVGLSSSSVRVLGTFHDVRSITGMKVTPVVAFVGELGDLSTLRLNPHEIDFAFALTLPELVGKRESMELGARGRYAVFTAGPEKVWGLTAYILDELLREVFDLDLPPP